MTQVGKIHDLRHVALAPPEAGREQADKLMAPSPVEGLRLRPAFAGRLSGLALSPAAAAGRIIHEGPPFVNNAG